MAKGPDSGLLPCAVVPMPEQGPFPRCLPTPLEFAAQVRHIYQNIMLNGEVIRLDGALRTAPR